ncbi:MAG: hypothetical protein WCI22_08440, partial [Actinomycetota bacterium]
DLKDKLERAGFVDVEVIHFGAPLGYVLESARNIISGRRLQHETTPVAASTATAAERSSASGRMLQPSKSATAVLSRLGTYPFRKLQLLFPGVGPGIIAIGHTPD